MADITGCWHLNALHKISADDIEPLRRKAKFTEAQVEDLENELGYDFDDKVLLEEALTHSSYAREHGLMYQNERLEYLGDSVLGFIIARALYKMYPEATEGELTRMRAELVKADSLFKKAQTLGLTKMILHGHSMKSDNLPKSICADAVEALIGAICLDGGIAAVERIIRKFFLSDAAEQSAEVLANPKLDLQMWLQARGMELPKYELISVVGPSHAPEFTVRLYLNGFEHIEKDRSRKGAEAKVATLILKDLKEKFGE